MRRRSYSTGRKSLIIQPTTINNREFTVCRRLASTVTTVEGLIARKPYEMKWKAIPLCAVLCTSAILGAIIAHKSAKTLEHLQIFIHDKDDDEDDE